MTAPTTRRRNPNSATPTRYDSYTRRATAGIGWFSLALGAAEVIAPRAISNLTGAKINSPLLKTFGARELVSGIGILTSRRPAAWLWGRVAGDIMDLAALGLMPLESDHDARTKRAAATVAVAGVALLDAALAVHHSTQDGSFTSRPRTPREQVTHFLSDMYSVERQALSQLVKAPEIAGDPILANDFRQHYTETEQQSHMVRNRLAALGGAPSQIKDAVMRLGGKGFLAVARAMPETPGRLVVHSYAYEAMEYAGYKMLIRFAAEAGDVETVELAEIIRDEEQEMMHRLERGFDAAEQVTHAALSQEDLAAHLQTHLNEVHAFESQAIELLEKAVTIQGARRWRLPTTSSYKSRAITPTA